MASPAILPLFFMCNENQFVFGEDDGMRRVVVAVAFVLGCSGLASAADEHSSWFSKHSLPFQKTAKGRRPIGPPNSNKNGSANADANASNAGGNNSGSNTGGGNSFFGGNFSFNNFFTTTDNSKPYTGHSKPNGKIAAPEIDPASGASALGLLSTALLMLRGRRKKLNASPLS